MTENYWCLDLGEGESQSPLVLLQPPYNLTLKFHRQSELKGELQMLQGEGHTLNSRKTPMIQ